MKQWLAPARCAVLVVDMQADFALPEGFMGRAGADLTSVPGALERATALVDASRRSGILVAFAGLHTSPATDSPVWREREERMGYGSGNGPCRAGDSGAQFVGPRPLANDTVVLKSRYSAFFGTDLDRRLRGRGVDTLVICGLTTECCVDCTVRDAFHLDYHVFVVADACAAYEPDLHAAALRNFELSFAQLATSAEIAGIWS